MLYYNFKNYEEFKEIFGIIEHGNGVKSRKNLILLALYKDRNALRNYIKYLGLLSNEMLWDTLSDRLARVNSRCTDEQRKHFYMLSLVVEHYERRLPKGKDSIRYGLLRHTTLAELKKNLLKAMTSKAFFYKDGYACHLLLLNGRNYYSDSFETDSMVGLCEDGTLNAIRYRNIEKDRVFKMKAGRMFNHLMSCNIVMNEMPIQIQRWLSEKWVEDWIEYARENISDTEHTLHVNDNFEDIYDSDCCAGYDVDSNSFGSCMVNDGQWTFYRDAVDAQAAYLTDDCDKIVARCIVFTNVTDQDGKKWRLAERQYSKFCDLGLQRHLVSALIRGGFIDGYKDVGASCHDSRAYVDNGGNSLSGKCFSIPCKLEDGDTLSYQDSFKWFDYDRQIATNYGSGDVDLATTDGEVSINNHEDDCWSSWNEEYISEDDAYWVETREDYFYSNQVVRAYVYNNRYDCYDEEWCFDEDCLEIDGDYYYAGDYAGYPSDYGIQCCPKCDEYFVPGRGDSCYSELTEEDYCCSDCMEEAEEKYKEDNWTYAEFGGEYVEDEDDVTLAMMWNKGLNLYVETTIKCETLGKLMDSENAVEIDGVNYIDAIGFDGEPVHFAAADLCVA